MYKPSLVACMTWHSLSCFDKTSRPSNSVRRASSDLEGAETEIESESLRNKSDSEKREGKESSYNL